MELPNMMHFEHKSDLIAMLDLVKIDQDDEGELIKTDYKSPPQINDVNSSGSEMEEHFEPRRHKNSKQVEGNTEKA
jgi:hypothetical protein